jgi:GT2 family glycosyltransferase
MEVDVLNGWFWMTRRPCFETVGPLDERFFMYGEDIDWCKRFSNAGWKRVYFAGAASIHYGGGSSSNAPVRYYIEQQRANLQYIRKHHSFIKQWGFLGTVWLYHILRIFGHAGSYLLPGSNRMSVSLKIKRSMACVQWLLGWTPSTIGRN